MPSAPAGTTDPRAQLVQQLQASRGELVRLFEPPSAPGLSGETSKTESASPLWRSTWWVVRRWWRGHPLNAPAAALHAGGRQLLAPIAAAHPWWLLGGAALFGGVLAWAGPRRLSIWLLPLLGTELRRAGLALVNAALR